MEDQKTNEPQELCLIKVYAIHGEEEPKQIYQLSAKGRDEYRILLKQLELLADILPYISNAEKECKKRQREFQYGHALENLKTAIALGMVDKSDAIDTALQLGGNVGE